MMMAVNPATIDSLEQNLLKYLFTFVDYKERFRHCRVISKKFAALLKPDLEWARLDPHTFKVLPPSTFVDYVVQFPDFLFQIYPLKISRAWLQKVDETDGNRSALRTAKLIMSQSLFESHMSNDNREIAFNLYLKMKSRETRVQESKPFHDLLKWGTSSLLEMIDLYTSLPPAQTIFRSDYLVPAKVDGTKKCCLQIQAVLVDDYLKLLIASPESARKVFAYFGTLKKIRHLFPLESAETSFPDPIFHGILDAMQGTPSFGGLVALQVNNQQFQRLCSVITGKKIEALRVNIIEEIQEQSFAALEKALGNVEAIHVEIKYHNHDGEEERCSEEISRRFTFIQQLSKKNKNIRCLKFDTCLENIPENPHAQMQN